MKKYEAYKNSSVEWIGKIPEGWSVVPLKHYLSLKGRIGWNGLKSEEFQEKSYAYLVTGQDFNSDIVNWEKCYQINKERYDEDPFIQLENGDLLVTKDGTIGKVAKVVNLDKPACLNSGIFVVKQTKGVFEQNYLYWVLVSNQLKEFVGFNSTGSTIAHLYQNVFENMPLTVPSLTEQQAIASYLDHKVGQIDASVSAINTQIDDLKAYRQSIISEAVTKGLKPDVKMKDSGIEGGWSIPVHWSSNRLKFLADIVRGGSPRPIEEYIADEGYNWIKIGDTIKGYKYIESTKEKIKPSGLNATREVHVNDLILSNSMSFGQPYILKIDGCIHDGWLAFTNYKGLDKEYLYYVLQAGVCSCQFEHYVAGGVVQNLNIEKVATTRIPLPPLTEQQSIATYLDKKTAQIDSSIDSLEVQRDDLNALKQSIISEAVTGKIDLRDWKQKN